MRLYDLPAAFAEIEAQIADSDGELPPDLERQLDTLQATLDEKFDGLCGLIEHWTTQAGAAEFALERIKRLIEVRRNKIKWAKDYLLRCLAALGLRRHETDLHKVSVCRNSRPAITWTGDLKDLPPCYKRVVVTEELDSNAALEVWKATGELPDGFRVVVGEHVRLK